MNIIIPCFCPKPKSWTKMQLKPNVRGRLIRLSRKRRKARERKSTATEANATQTQPKLAPNKGLPAGYNPEVKHIPPNIWPLLSQAQKDAHFQKHKMGKFNPNYDPNNPGLSPIGKTEMPTKLKSKLYLPLLSKPKPKFLHLYLQALS